MRVKVIRECVNQETKKRMYPGDIVELGSAFEVSRLMAFKDVVPMPDLEEREAAVVQPPEIRVFRRKKARYNP